LHTDGQRLDVSFTGYTAFPHRAPGYNLIVISESYTAMKPFMDPGDVNTRNPPSFCMPAHKIQYFGFYVTLGTLCCSM